MPRQKQTRRSVSVKGLTYQRLKKHCDAQGISVAGWLENLIVEELGPVTDEIRQEFGEFLKAGEKAKETTQTAPEEPHEPRQEVPEPAPQPQPPAPVQETAPAPSDEAREAAPEPAPDPVPAAPAAAEPAPEREPELPRKVADARPDEEPESKRRKHGPWKHRLAEGTPVKRKSEPKPEEEHPEFEDYIPPILQF